MLPETLFPSRGLSSVILFHWIVVECGQWDRQRPPLQRSISRIGMGCGRAEARPYNKKHTLHGIAGYMAALAVS